MPTKRRQERRKENPQGGDTVKKHAPVVSPQRPAMERSEGLRRMLTPSAERQEQNGNEAKSD
jgi:hypothetical protein